MRYTLSNRQLKELANGKALQIALPDPGPDVVTDGGLVAWACETLAGVDAGHVRQAERESIEVFRQRQDQQLADEIGTIRLEQTPYTDRLTWWVEVIVVTLCERDKPRGTYPVQWPARYEIGED
jgi:hypothetical protein